MARDHYKFIEGIKQAIDYALAGEENTTQEILVRFREYRDKHSAKVIDLAAEKKKRDA